MYTLTRPGSNQRVTSSLMGQEKAIKYEGLDILMIFNIKAILRTNLLPSVTGDRKSHNR